MTICVRVDEYFELMGVVAYLSGNLWYKKGEKNEYVTDVDKHFRLYKKHPIIKKYAEVGFDKLVFMATLLEYKKGKFVLRKEQEKKAELFEKSDEFLKLLADFYKTSCFHSFFEQHKPFYARVCSYYDNVVQSLNTDWFKYFFGSTENCLFSVVSIPISLYECFGLYRHFINQPEEHIAVLCQPDFFANSQCGQSFLLRIVYEYLHSFIDPLLCGSEERQKKLESVAVKVLGFSRWTMQQQGYTDWCTLMNEYLVRAVTNVYMQENKFTKQDIRCDIMSNIEHGFYLMPELVGYMNKYRYCRDKFKTFGDFYSEVAKFFSSYIDKEIKRVDDIVSVILEV